MQTTVLDRPRVSRESTSKPKGGEYMLTVFSVYMRGILARVREESGQGLAEYALILALVAVVVVAALIFLQGGISGILSSVGSKL